MTRAELEAERNKLKKESDVQSEIRRYLLSTHRPYSVTDATEAFNRSGRRVMRVREFWPDITTVTKDGRIFAIECKRGSGGVLSQGQALMLRKIYEWGGLVCIARSVADVQEAETMGFTRAKDLAEIAKAIAKTPKSGLEHKPIDSETGF